ncbi:MAG: aspartate/glutamate racemase family protein [Hyphomicrobiaceae bacterium]
MEIVIINPNTDTAMTASLETAAKQVAPAGVTIRAVTAEFGPPLLTRRRDIAVATGAVLAAVSKHSECAGAFVLASVSDPALEAAREVAPVPVVALCEAATYQACQLGSRVGLLFSAPEMIPAIEEKLRAYGLADRVCGIRTPSSSPVDGPTLRREDLIATYADLGRRLVMETRAEVLVLGGGPLIGLASELQTQLPVPVIDAVECAVLQAYVLARLKPKKPSVGSFSYPPKVAVTGTGADLQRLFLVGLARGTTKPENAG